MNQKRKIGKRIASWLLCLVMLLTLSSNMVVYADALPIYVPNVSISEDGIMTWDSPLFMFTEEPATGVDEFEIVIADEGGGALCIFARDTVHGLSYNIDALFTKNGLDSGIYEVQIFPIAEEEVEMHALTYNYTKKDNANSFTAQPGNVEVQVGKAAQVKFTFKYTGDLGRGSAVFYKDGTTLREYSSVNPKSGEECVVNLPSPSEATTKTFVVSIHIGDDWIDSDEFTVTWKEGHEHIGGRATCTKKAVCEDCGEEYGELNPGNHDFSKCVSNGDGTHKVVCADCGAIQSGHDKDACSGGTATCTAKAKCTKCKAEYGSLKAHTTTNVTTPATFSVAGKVEAKCSACGKITKTVSTIAIPKTFTLAKTSYEYTGSQIKPTITIKDSNGTTISSTYYTLTYGTNKAVGKGTVKVEFKNKYKGTKTLEFKIVPKTTTIGTPAIASDGITVKWTKNTSCAGYYIYRSVNGASYTKVKTIESNATVSWKDTNAKTNGYKYQYKIIAYKTVSGATYTSAASAIKTIYFLTRPTVTLTNTATGVKVAWGKNAKATGYYVYRSTDGGKTYKNIKTITSNATVSFTDTAAKTNGTKYMYKVVAYKTVSSITYKSIASAAKTYYFISKPAISSLTNSAAGKMLIKWARNAKATGYQIQYSTSSDFSGAKTVTATGTTTTLSKTIGSLTKGKTYYVRIRSYKTVGTTKYYSAWSDKKSVKIVK